MAIQFTEYTEAHTEAVRAFNARLREGGMNMQFPTDSLPRWLPPADAQRLYQEQFVAVDEQGEVRGGYILKHQDFKIGDAIVPIADLRLPISEGSVDREHAAVATELLFNALAKQPLLFGMGIGGYDEAVAKLFQAAGWRLFTIPFFVRVLRPFRFCRRIRFLRRSWPRRLALDVAAFSGLGWLGTKTLHLFQRRSIANPDLSIEVVEEFDSWADEVWQQCDDQYGMIAVRNSDVLRRLYPSDDSRFIRLRFSMLERTIGWCVLLDTQLTDHKQFGTLRLGSIVDGLAATDDAKDIVSAATDHLARRGVDLIVSNQSHADWCDAFRSAGYLRGPSNYLFAMSRRLSKMLDKSHVDDDRTFINRGDGDGPINL